MKVLREGHRYELENFEKKDEPGQVIQFIEKVPSEEPGSKQLITVNDGTTIEELVEVILDRLNSQGKKLPCRENSIAITNFEQGLLWLNRRTQNRIKANVEGLQKAH